MALIIHKQGTILNSSLIAVEISRSKATSVPFGNLSTLVLNRAMESIGNVTKHFKHKWSFESKEPFTADEL